MERVQLLAYLQQKILSLDLDRPVCVGIDGIDASGKTTLADELFQYMSQDSRQLVRASIDNFHQPRAYRYQKGQLSPYGYYHHSFNYAQLVEKLLNPLAADGSRQYQTAAFDYRTDSPVEAPFQAIADHAILIMDGIFLFRPELVNYWDIRIFLDIGFATSLTRGVQRALENDPIWQTRRAELIEAYEKRYIPGQKLYFAEAHPQAHAHIIIDNTDWTHPEIILDQSLS